LIIDESINVSVISHVVVFAIFVEEGIPVTTFLGLLEIGGGKKDVQTIFDCLLKSIQEWGLDMEKCDGFGSDGASTMVEQRSSVASIL